MSCALNGTWAARSALVVWALTSAACTSVWVREGGASDPPRSLAVLPFGVAPELLEEYRDDAPLLEHLRLRARDLEGVVAERFALLPYLHLARDQVEDRLGDAGLLAPRERLGSAEAARLRELLGVDLVVQGVLSEDLHVQAGVVYWRSIGCRLEVIDLRRGGQLYATLERTEGDLGGLLMEMGQPAEGLEDTIDSHSELAFLRLADLLADELAREFPRPATPPEVTAPVIERVRWRLDAGPWSEASREAQALVSRPAQRAGPGAILGLELRGTPGQRAALRLSGGRSLPLEELQPGRYAARYRVSVGERCVAPRLVLAGPFGAADARELPLRIEGEAPRAPQRLSLTRRGAQVELSWEPPPGGEEGGAPGRYRVYEEDAAQGLQEAAEAQGLEARLPAREGVRAYLVAALSEAGALGPPARVASSAGLGPEGPGQ